MLFQFGDRCGTATDTGSGIALVQYKFLDIKSTGRMAAGRLLPARYNWGVTNLALQAGTNYFIVKCVNGSGMESPLKTWTIQHVVTNQITVNIVGSGSCNPTNNGAWLEINRTTQSTQLRAPIMFSPTGLRL